jgi:hypothetical protein
MNVESDWRDRLFLKRPQCLMNGIGTGLVLGLFGGGAHYYFRSDLRRASTMVGVITFPTAVITWAICSYNSRLEVEKRHKELAAFLRQERARLQERQEKLKLIENKTEQK